MSDEALRDLVVRMATDPRFAEQVRADPAGVAAAHGLTVEQVTVLGELGDGAGGAGPSMLDARLSKSSLFFGGGLHVGPHGFDPPAPIEPQAHIGGHDPAGFLCDGIDPAGMGDGSVHPAGFLCNGIDPAGMGDGSVHPASIECNGMAPNGMGDGSVHPAGFVGDGHGAPVSPNIVGPDHSAAVPSAAAPVSLLTGKIVAPVDSHSHTAGAVGPLDSHLAVASGDSVSYGTGGGEGYGSGGGEGHVGVIGPTDSHAAKGLIDPTVHGAKGVVAPVDSHAALPVDPAAMQCTE